MIQMRVERQQSVMQRTLAGYVNHPNFAGVLVLGLGCEVNQAARLMDDFLRLINRLARTRRRAGEFAAARAGIEAALPVLESAHRQLAERAKLDARGENRRNRLGRAIADLRDLAAANR